MTGNLGFPCNQLRSVRPDRFLPLVSVPGTRLVRLTKGLAVARLAETCMGGLILDAFCRNADLADAAALSSALDLMI
ncbi:MAG: hypothetical protein AAF667_11780 [Pseudomonadota bacterium]